jgi:hypothetical protein
VRVECPAEHQSEEQRERGEEDDRARDYRDDHRDECVVSEDHVVHDPRLAADFGDDPTGDQRRGLRRPARRRAGAL